ncbi:MAG: RHS repeat-associated core domain-containing protein [Chlorobia bacterium]|nr:RHS repeat-associated core domain-containing protein [Fimbriimonadaceae bacterium]
MGVTNYYSVDGEMVGDYDGVDHRDYLRDAVGSVTRITGGTTQRYMPFGQDRVVDLHLPRPRFGWIGVYGYEATYLRYSHHYVKTRHYDPNIARWTTVDPLWPSEPAYTYAGNNPTNWIDPSGQKATFPPGSTCSGDASKLNDCCDKTRKFLMPNGTLDRVVATRIAKCVAQAFKGSEVTTLLILNHLGNMCNNDKSPNVCVFCASGTGRPVLGLPSSCTVNCQSNAMTIVPLPTQEAPWIPIWNPDACQRFNPRGKCVDDLRNLGCSAVLAFCYDVGKANNPSYCSSYMHELIHTGHIAGSKSHNKGSASADYVYAIECCLCQAMNLPAPNRPKEINPACESACLFFFPKLKY